MGRTHIYIFIVTILIFVSCNTRKDKAISSKIARTDKIENEIELTIFSDTSQILLTDTNKNYTDIKYYISIKSLKNNWVKVFPEDKKTIRDNHVKPSYIIDTINNTLFFNLFGEYFYKMDLLTGKILNKINFISSKNFNNKKPRYEINGNQVLIYSTTQLLVFTNDLKLKYNFRNKLEFDEIKRLNLINNDTILLENANNKSIIFDDFYSFKEITHNIEGDSIIVKYIFTDLSLKDTVIFKKYKL